MKPSIESDYETPDYKFEASDERVTTLMSRKMRE